ncbi:hypothetical protein D3C71_1842610 [compost metagenome]
MRGVEAQAYGTAGMKAGAGQAHGARHDCLSIDQRVDQGVTAHTDDIGHGAVDFMTARSFWCRCIKHL